MSGSTDGTLAIWNRNSGQIEGWLEGHSGAILSIAILPDGNRAVSAGADHTVILWNLTTRTAEGRLDGHSAAVLCVAVTTSGTHAVSGSQDGHDYCLEALRTCGHR